MELPQQLQSPLQGALRCVYPASIHHNLQSGPGACDARCGYIRRVHAIQPPPALVMGRDFVIDAHCAGVFIQGLANY